MNDYAKEARELRLKLAEEQEKNAVLQQDIRDFCFVNYEIMKLFGLTIDQIVQDKVEISSVVKAIKSKIVGVMTDPEGFASLLSHFQEEAVRIGMKYKDLAQELSRTKTGN